MSPEQRLRNLGIVFSPENTLKLRNNLRQCKSIDPRVRQKFVTKLDRLIEKQSKGVNA